MKQGRVCIAIVEGLICPTFEYLCLDCGRYRVSFISTNRCLRCRSYNIIKGRPGSLKKEYDNGLEG